MSTSNLIPAGIWVRVSSGGQDEANQVPDLERYCAERGYAIAKRYELHDKSAYKGEQEARQQEALADTRAGHIKVLTVWASDRLERRGAEATLRIFRLFRDAGGQVESVLEPFLNTGDAELMQAITGWKDKQESARKSERVLAGLNRIKENEALQGRPGWGYETAGQKYRRRLVPTPKGRKYAPLIYEWIAGGESLSTVAQWLDEQGVRPACTRKKRGKECRTCDEGGHRWWPRTLGVWVRNPANFGYRCAYEDPKRRTHGKVLHRIAEPLVDAALWKRANDRLDKVPGKCAPAAPGNRAMLTGVIFCPRCADSPLYRIKAACGLFYRCSGRGRTARAAGTWCR